MATAPGNPARPVPADAFVLEETYHATRLPVEYASTLIPDAYTSEEFHALEQERLFGSSWVPVCIADELAEPGAFVVVTVAGRSIIVCRNAEGELRAHHNVCRHRGAQLVDDPYGKVKRFFQCPYHAWAYDLDGECLGTPLFTPEAGIPEDQRGIFDMSGVKAFDKRDHGLHPVRVDAWGGIVFACLDPDVPPLAEQLGDLPERLAGYGLAGQRLVRRVEYEIDANWKLVAENFTEYYHLPWVHPGLVKVSPMSAHHRWQGSGMYVGFCTTPIAANTEDGGWQGLPPMKGLSSDDAESARFVWLFPSMAINALPNHSFFMLTRPTSAGHTSEVTYLLLPDETHAALDADGNHAVDELLAFWDEVNREDIGIVERVQRGLANTAYTGGRMCYRFEESVHRFQNMVIDRVLGVRRVPAGDSDA
jgi:phenylpropionate dioxygenase-like ring-hydroxylating dioxygenase large terminal subunit